MKADAVVTITAHDVTSVSDVVHKQSQGPPCRRGLVADRCIADAPGFLEQKDGVLRIVVGICCELPVRMQLYRSPGTSPDAVVHRHVLLRARGLLQPGAR